MNRVAVAYALISAALFGMSTPAAKILIGSVHPAVLAGLLYCGAGIGIAVLRRTLPSSYRARPRSRVTRRAALASRSDRHRRHAWPVAADGRSRPTMLSSASLLLTFEGAATALMAWFIFHENFDRRIALGMGCLLAGAAVLSWTSTPTMDSLAGPLLIAGACLCWGLDNNLTRKVSLTDPLQIVEVGVCMPDHLISWSASRWGPLCRNPLLLLLPGSRFLWLWTEPRAFCLRFARSRDGANCSILFHGTIYRRRSGANYTWRTNNGAGRG